MNYDYIFKIVMIGDSSTGKTSMVKRLCENKFMSVCNGTIGIDFSTKITELENGILVKSQIWDTGGNIKFKKLLRQYYKGVACIVVTFSLSSNDSFQSVPNWLDEIKNNIIDDNPRLIILVGNKSDVQHRTVSREEAEKFSKNNGLIYIETSAKINHNIKKLEMCIVNNIYNNMDNSISGIQSMENHLKDNFNDDKQSRYNCCWLC